MAVKTDLCSVPEPKIIDGVVSCELKLPNETTDLLLVCVYNPLDNRTTVFTDSHKII